MRALKIK